MSSFGKSAGEYMFRYSRLQSKAGEAEEPDSGSGVTLVNFGALPTLQPQPLPEPSGQQEGRATGVSGHRRAATVIRKPPRPSKENGNDSFVRCSSVVGSGTGYRSAAGFDRRGAIVHQEEPSSSSDDDEDFVTADELEDSCDESGSSRRSSGTAGASSDRSQFLRNRGHVARCAGFFQGQELIRSASLGESFKIRTRRQSGPGGTGCNSGGWASKSTDALAASEAAGRDEVMRRESSVGGRGGKDYGSKAMSYVAPPSNSPLAPMFSERPVDVPEGTRGTYWPPVGGSSRTDLFGEMTDPVILKDRFAQIKIVEVKKGAEQKKTKKNFYAALTNKIIAVYKNEENFALSQLTIALDLKGARVERKPKGRRAFAFQLLTLLQQRVVFTGEEGVVDRWLHRVGDSIKRLNMPGADDGEEDDVLGALGGPAGAEGGAVAGPSGEAGKKHAKLGRNKSVKDEPKTEETEQRRKLRTKLKKFFHRRPTMESIKMSGIYKDEPVFGSFLPALCAVDGMNIPRFVQSVIEVIESKEENLKSDGLYRASGNLSQVQRIRCYADQDRFDVMKSEEDIHVLTGALKLFFRELKEPLIPAYLIKNLLIAANMKEKQDRLPIFQAALAELPECHRETYFYVLCHLQKVVRYSHFNRMDEANISIVFGPTLMWLEMDSPDMASELMNRNLIVQVMLKDLDDILRLCN